MKIDKQGA